jgi:hypothetical protein
MMGNLSRRLDMDSTTIQIIAGIGAVIILAIIIWRRKSESSK